MTTEQSKTHDELILVLSWWLGQIDGTMGTSPDITNQIISDTRAILARARAERDKRLATNVVTLCGGGLTIREV